MRRSLMDALMTTVLGETGPPVNHTVLFREGRGPEGLPGVHHQLAHVRANRQRASRLLLGAATAQRRERRPAATTGQGRRQRHTWTAANGS